MPGLGNDLVVNLAGNNAKLKSVINESKGGLKGFAASATELLSPVTAGLASLAGGAVAAGVAIYGLQSNLSTLGGIASKSKQTDLSGAFLQRLGYAANQSGVDVETLTGAVRKLTITIGNADAKPFEAIGLSLKELQGLTPEKQFKLVAERIGEIPTAAGRASAAMKVFGKSGIEMTGLFTDGVDGLNKMLTDAQALGIGVSDEGLAKAAKADSAIQRMKASFGAMLDQVTVGLAPAFEYVATTIADMIPPVTKLFDQLNGLNDKAQFLGDLLDASMSVAFESIKANWDLMLGEMVIAATNAGKEIAMNLDPATAVGRFIGGRAGKAIGGPQAAEGQTKLDAAKQNLDAVLARLDAVKPFVPQGPQAPAKDDGSKLAGLFGGIAEAAGPILGGLKSKIAQEVEGAKLTGNWFQKTAENLFTGPKIKDPKSKEAKDAAAPEKVAVQFAGAMQRGSAEAYSTIVNAMRGNKDPQVKAIDKSTKAIVAAVKGNKQPQPKIVGAFT